MRNMYIAFILLYKILFVTCTHMTDRHDIIQFPSLASTTLDFTSPDIYLGLVFVMCCLFAGVAIHFGSKKYHYPYTVGCFLFGVVVGVIKMHSKFAKKFTVLTEMDPSAMLLAFLPILIFESSFGMDAHMFYKALPQCLLLAIVGFLFCTALTAVFAKFVLQMYGWNWLTAIVFGSIISATDPVAVVALLREMKMPHTFTTLIEGESLLNDGVAIVLYEILTHQMRSGKQFEFGSALIELLKTCIGAPVFGYILGKLAEWILIRIYVSPISEMTITLVLAYITYFVAEGFLGVSAVVAVVICGVTLNSNRMCISPESETLVHTDWRLLSVYANTLIFIIVGILITFTFSKDVSLQDFGFILVTYVVLTVLRSLMIAVLYPLLKSTGYGLNWKESVILSWGGLRGAIGLALALMLAVDRKLQESVNTSKVLVQVSGVIVLTLIVNANSIAYIMKIINFSQITLVNKLSMDHAIACITDIKEKSLRICKRHWKFMRADWQWVDANTSLKDQCKYHSVDENSQKGIFFVPFGKCYECSSGMFPYTPSAEELYTLKEAARKSVLRALKGNLWTQFRKGLIQRRSLRLLCVAADNAVDIPNLYVKAEDIKEKFMTVSRHNHWLETKLSYLMEKLKVRKCAGLDPGLYELKEKDFGNFRNCCLLMYFSSWIELLIFSVIVLNVIHISFDLYFLLSSKPNDHQKTMNHLALFLILFYILEIVIKICALSWHRYIAVSWNKLDFAVTVYSIFEGTVDVILLSYYPTQHVLATHIRLLICLRLFKYFSFVLAIFYKILSVIRNHASSNLYCAYDIGRAFLFATEAVLKNIDVIIDFKPCAEIPISVCEKNIKQMLDILSNFEQNYPSVAVALKSNRAARRILNRVKIVLNALENKSHILQEEAMEIKSILFKMTKTVVFAPRAGASYIRDIKHILLVVHWMNLEIAEFIHDNHSIVTFNSGEVIQEAGKFQPFVLIIVKGIVKIVCEESEQPFQGQNKLPNVHSLNFFEEFEKKRRFFGFLTTAQTIGLLGFLLKTPPVSSAVCEKDCELIQIDYSTLNKAQEIFDDFTFRLWRSISIRIAIPLLRKHWLYKTYTIEEINLLLQKAVLPDLTQATSIEVPSIVEDMVLIQGRIKDALTKDEFFAPSYIPRTSRKLKLLDEMDGRPPVIVLLLLEKNDQLPYCNNWIKPEEINKCSQS